MIRKRIIPVLLLKENKLIHRKNFNEETDIYVGDPINAINIFNQYQVDEMAFIDVTKKKDSINFNLLEKIAGEAFFPMTYGGYIKNIEDAKKIINIGFEKIIINSVIFENPNLVNELVKFFGSQSIIVSIDLYSQNEKYFLYDHKKGQITKKRFDDYASEIVKLNPGEILITHVNNDGEMNGYDLKFVDFVANFVNKPVIYKGGSLNYDGLKKVLTNSNINAVASSSIFIMKKKDGGIVLNYPNYEEKIKIYGNL
jgi:cyclase